MITRITGIFHFVEKAIVPSRSPRLTCGSTRSTFIRYFFGFSVFIDRHFLDIKDNIYMGIFDVVYSLFPRMKFDLATEEDYVRAKFALLPFHRSNTRLTRMEDTLAPFIGQFSFVKRALPLATHLYRPIIQSGIHI